MGRHLPRRIGSTPMRAFRALILLLPLIVRTGQSAAQPAPPLVSTAVDLKSGIVHSQRLESGVPLGGIGTGTFQVMTDGSISRATINNNWCKPTGDVAACFAAIWTQTGSQRT